MQREHLRKEKHIINKIHSQHELNDISLSRATAVSEQLLVAVQSRHLREVRAAHADDDDGQWLRRGLDDGLDGGVLVVDHAVRQHQQDRVLLVLLTVKKLKNS